MPFRDVIGHRTLVSLLARSIARDTLPPSLIFAGPSGVGKRLAALATAQAVNCLAPVPASDAFEDRSSLDIDACGTCAACTRIARGVHPDVLLIEPGDTGTIKIEPIRDLIDRASYRPFEGKRRVVIIDDADALLPSAQNAMLKTLEEPPSASMFILITARPDALLATVRSRCPRLRFQPLTSAEVIAALMRLDKTPAEARAAAAVSDGSVGRALESSTTDAGDARDVALRILTDIARSDDPRHRVESAKVLVEKTGKGGATDREQLSVHLRALSTLLRDIELVGTSADRRSLANQDLEASLGQLSAFQGERGLQAFGAVDRALGALERNASVKVVADWLALQL